MAADTAIMDGLREQAVVFSSCENEGVHGEVMCLRGNEFVRKSHKCVTIIPKKGGRMMEDNKWANAMQEAGSPAARDANLWAQCFAEAGGDEAKAQAAYVNRKVGISAFPTQPQQTVQIVKSAKSRGIYIILALFLGTLGIHNFYAGRLTRGAIQLIITLVAGWFVIGLVITGLWALIDIFTVKTDGAGDKFA